MGESGGAMTGAEAPVPKQAAHRAWARAALGYALALACLVWVFRDFEFGNLVRRAAAMNLWWVAAAVLCDVLSYACQGARWSLLLRPLGEVSVLRSTQAIYAGLFVNEVLPMKLGELTRALLVSRWTRARLGSVAASILVERLCDGVWLAAGVVLAALFVPLPHSLVEAGDVFGAGILIALALLFLLAVVGRRESPDREGPASITLRGRLSHAAAAFVRRLSLELRVIGRSRGAAWAFVLSLVLLLAQGLSFWMVTRAYGLRLPFLAGVVVFLVVHLGTALPAAPANIGTYQFLTVLGLTALGVDKTTAAGFSVVVFALLTVPLWAIGFWALGRSGLTLLEVSRVRGFTEPRN